MRRTDTLCEFIIVDAQYRNNLAAFIKSIVVLQRKWDNTEVAVTGRQQNTVTKCDKNVESRHLRRQIWRQNQKYFVHF